MNTLWLDLETYSTVDLKKTGVYPYATHPSTEILLIAYAVDNGPVHVWDLTTGEPIPADLKAALIDPTVTLVAHNAAFDRVLLAEKLPLYGAQLRDPARWQCSMVKALCHALPPGLGDLGKALGLPEDQRKLAEGRKLIARFCKPAPANHTVRRYTRETHPAEWARFVEYARQDVAAMRDLWSRMPDHNWTPHEQMLWHLDQAINDRGFAVDVPLAAAGSRAAEVEKAALAERVTELTGGLVRSATQRDQLLAYVNARFELGLPDLTKDTLQQRLKQDDLPPTAREILELRLSANKTSTAKYAAIHAALGADGRFRGGLQFAGAGRTRRFAGRIFQPQNLPSRGLPDARDIDLYIDALKVGVHHILFDDLMRFGAAATRGLLVAPPGKKLCVADLSNIEGRVLAWVAGEQWKLDAFRAYDAGTGPDLYNLTAVSIIGGDPWKVPKKVRNIFGKVPDLASGYMGGVPGYQQFAHAYGVRMADSWSTIQAMVDADLVARAQENAHRPHAKRQIAELGISATEWVASEACKLAWRARHPATVAFWRVLQDAAINATLHPNLVYQAGPVQAESKTYADQKWLFLKLPSGRYLTYFDPHVKPGEYGLSLSYMALASEEGSTSRAWIRTWTHGGKLTGNVVQTLAGDLLKDSLPRIEQADYLTVLSVHDELVCEAPDTPDYTSDTLAQLMAMPPTWAADLPLAAAGFETYRYRKD